MWFVKTTIVSHHMKTTTALCLTLSVVIATSSTAQADWGHRDEHRSARHEHRHHRGHDHNYRQHSKWVGPAAILAITGLAIGAAAYSQANAAPVYAPPAQPVQLPPDSGNWHYCNSSDQYYPYVRYCPEGWQPVMPPR
jgi:hypothetical protein